MEVLVLEDQEMTMELKMDKMDKITNKKSGE